MTGFGVTHDARDAGAWRFTVGAGEHEVGVFLGRGRPAGSVRVATDPTTILVREDEPAQEFSVAIPPAALEAALQRLRD